jgi:serine/threonine-protein kinase
VFALGVVLWEAVTGRHLFRRDTELATMRAIVDEPIPPPTDVTPVAPQLEQIIMRALEKRRDDRFQSSQEMALALERYAFASEGFSPLQLASYVKGLFDVEFAQWKRTVSSALDIEARPGVTTQSGTRFPVIKPDLPTRGTVALRPGQSSSQLRQGLEAPREVTTDLRTDAPTRRDWMWIGSGLATLVVIVLAGALVLSKPRAAISVPVPATPAAPSQWQGTPPIPTPPSTPPAVTPARANTGVAAEPTPPEAPPSEAERAKHPEPRPEQRAATDPSASTRPRGDRTKPRGHSAKHATQAPGVNSDHRPNPFE